MSTHDVIVIGAGLAGLNAAHTLSAAGRDVVVLERDERVGGRTRTDVIDGLQLDHGFQLVNPAYPELQRLGILHELDLRPFAPGMLLSDAQGITAVGDPRRVPGWLASTATARIGTLAEKVQLAAALVRLLGTGSLTHPVSRPGSVADALIGAGVPEVAYRKLLRPFLTGVFLDDPAHVPAGYGDFVLRSFFDGAPSLPARGIEALPRALALRLPADVVRTGVTVQGITAGGVDTDHGPFEAPHIIVAVDAPAVAALLPGVGMPETLACTTWYHVMTQAPTDRPAILVDAEARGPVVNSAPVSLVAPGYATGGRTLLASTTLGADNGAEVEAAVRTHLSAMWHSNVSEWQLVRAHVVHHALPSLTVGGELHREHKVADGIWLAGDHRETPSQQGALLSGRRAAQAVLSA